MAASDRVFDICELFAMVAGLLPVRDLLALRGVCKGFKAKVEHIEQLNIDTFRKPGRVLAEWPLPVHTAIALMPYRLPNVDISIEVHDILMPGTHSVQMHFHPAWFAAYDTIHHRLGSDSDGAAWLRGTLIAQPPPKRFYLYLPCRHEIFDQPAYAGAEGGVRLGQVIDMVQAMARRCPRAGCDQGEQGVSVGTLH